MIADKKTKVLQVRVAEDDLKYLKIVAFMAGMSVSKYMRTLLDASINATKLSIAQGKVKLEDFASVLNDKLQ